MLLNGGQLLKWDLHTHVAPADHDAAALLTDLLNVVDAGLILDLGNELNIRGPVCLQKCPHIQQILTAGDKGTGNEIHILLNAEQQIRLVLLTEEGLLEHLVGEAHTLAVGHLAPGQHLADHVGVGSFLHLEDQQTVVHQHPVAALEVIGQPGIADGDVVLVALLLPGGKGEGIPLPDLDLPVFKGADAILRTLGVQHNGNGQAQLLPHALDELDLLTVLLVGAMGKVQPGHIHARLTQAGQRLLVTGRADGAYDLCFTHNHSLLCRCQRTAFAFWPYPITAGSALQ